MNDLAYYFINHILNKIPSRKIRMLIYNLISRGRISNKATIGLNVKILNIRNILIDDYSNVNYDSILDGRGGVIQIGKNVDIAPQVNIWTLQHDICSKRHLSTHGNVILHDGVWIGNRAIILPNSCLGKDSVIGAGVTIKGELDKGNICVNQKYRLLNKKIRCLDPNFKLSKIRRFR